MSTLADDIHAELTDYRKGPRCSLGALLEDLPDTDRAALQAALDDRTIPTSIILRAIQRNHNVAKASVGNHRKGVCQCPRPEAKPAAKKR
jgi:hypothetical protein